MYHAERPGIGPKCVLLKKCCPAPNFAIAIIFVVTMSVRSTYSIGRAKDGDRTPERDDPARQPPVHKPKRQELAVARTRRASQRLYSPSTGLDCFVIYRAVRHDAAQNTTQPALYPLDRPPSDPRASPHSKCYMVGCRTRDRGEARPSTKATGSTGYYGSEQRTPTPRSATGFTRAARTSQRSPATRTPLTGTSSRRTARRGHRQC